MSSSKVTPQIIIFTSPTMSQSKESTNAPTPWTKTTTILTSLNLLTGQITKPINANQLIINQSTPINRIPQNFMMRPNTKKITLQTKSSYKNQSLPIISIDHHQASLMETLLIRPATKENKQNKLKSRNITFIRPIICLFMDILPMAISSKSIRLKEKDRKLATMEGMPEVPADLKESLPIKMYLMCYLSNTRDFRTPKPVIVWFWICLQDLENVPLAKIIFILVPKNATGNDSYISQIILNLFSYWNISRLFYDYHKVLLKYFEYYRLPWAFWPQCCTHFCWLC